LGVLLALAASLSWGAGDFLGGVASRRANATTVVALTMTVGLAFVSILTLVTFDSAPPARDLAAALGAGVGGAIGLAGLYRGMAVGAMGVVAPISATAAVVPFAVGMLGGERPGGLQVAGVVAALAGVALVSREPSEPGAPPARAAGVGLALAAAVGFGLYFVLMDAAADESATWAVLVARATASMLGIAAVALLRLPLRVPRALVPMVLVIGLLDVSANVLFGLATSRGLLSVVSVLASLYPVVTVALAWVVLHERTSGVQRAGAAAALAGAALITAG
jgi:drug/metabolite transporter (DMT)-like permease